MLFPPLFFFEKKKKTNPAASMVRGAPTTKLVSSARKQIMSKRPTQSAANVPARGQITVSEPVEPSQYLTDPILADSACRAVAAWFEANQRPLPWRHTIAAQVGTAPPRDAYGTWVCEVMSQQTRIQTVIEFWKRWMAAFPTVSALAAADAERVRSLWTGLGFYRRASLLHKGAQYVVSHHGGKLPTSAAALRGIPGIGPYTAGAIASICFSEMTPAVDGNVVRVLSRLCGVRDFDPKNPKSIKLAWSWADSLFKAAESATRSGAVQSKSRVGREYHPGSLTEGLIELGATVCKPNGPPDCLQCPISTHCKAKQLLEINDIESIDGVIPCRGGKPKVSVDECISVVHECPAPDNNTTTQYVLVQRPPTGLLANLYEFPSILLPSVPRDQSEESEDSEADERLVPEINPLIANAMSAIQRNCKIPTRYVGRYVHKFSHIHLTVHVVVVSHSSSSSLQKCADPTQQLLPKHCGEGGAVLSSDGAQRKVVTLESMKELGVSKTVSKTIALLNRVGKDGNAMRSGKEARTSTRVGPSKRSRSSSS
jgi:A/G-specific adenine glycosylase